MSGDSPNAFVNENVFEFKEGRSSPAPTTSKDVGHGGGSAVTASVLVEPQKEVSKDKDTDKEKDEDKPDFSSPIFNNPGEDKGDRRNSGEEKALDLNDPNYDKMRKDKKEGERLLNGDPNKSASVPKNNVEEEEEDSCIVNCLYFTMECCKCTIM